MRYFLNRTKAADVPVINSKIGKTALACRLAAPKSLSRPASFMIHFFLIRVALSKRASFRKASREFSPHISADGRKPAQTEGRSGLPNSLQR